MCHPPRDSYQQKGQGQSSGPQHPTGNQEVRRGGLREVHQQAVDPRVYEQLRPLPTDFAVTVSSSFPYLCEPRQTTESMKKGHGVLWLLLGSAEHILGERGTIIDIIGIALSEAFGKWREHQVWTVL